MWDDNSKTQFFNNCKMDTKILSRIDNPELVNYIKTVGKELALSIKKTKKANLDVALRDVLYCLNEPAEEKQKTMLDYQQNNEATYPNDKSRIRSVVNLRQTHEDNNDDINNIFNPSKKNSKNKSFHDRKKDELIRKEKKLEIIKNKKRIEEQKNFKEKPQMAKNSQKIIDKLSYKKPIYARTTEILKNRDQKVEKMKSMYSELKNIEEEESIGVIKLPTHYNENHFNEWRKTNDFWEKNKNEKIVKIKQENENLETETFKNLHHPSIDKRSELMVRSKVLNDENYAPIYDKLFNLHNEKPNKIHQLMLKNMPTFSPSINNKIPNFLQNTLSNKITKNSSISNGRTSSLQKNNTNSKNALNCSIDSLLLKNYNEIAFNKYSRNKINSSMTELYNNPLINNDEEEPVSRYRLALQLSKFNNKKSHPKLRTNNSMDNRDRKMEIPWQTSIHFVNNKVNEKKEAPNSLYKINVRNNSAWDKNKENQIMFDHKISNVLRSARLINKTSSSFNK